ncbi:hypothetical protein CBS147332_1242 [Penicillium roqueforti]|nr:hypothetical protein CBS147332_1242 [Penicillium roqueforti]KAI3122803.1 hypothetical protein CBS147331_1253 [Penicillium roqueforti]
MGGWSSSIGANLRNANRAHNYRLSRIRKDLLSGASVMETAAEVILRPVPPLIQINDTRYVSNSSEVISLRFFHE